MSQTISIPENLFLKLEKNAKFGESPSEVIERLIQNESLPEGEFSKSTDNLSKTRETEDSHPPVRIFSKEIIKSEMGYEFIITCGYDGKSIKLLLPDSSNKYRIKEITDKVQEFVKTHGGTVGQINAARKKLTENGYRITKY